MNFFAALLLVSAFEGRLEQVVALIDDGRYSKAEAEARSILAEMESSPDVDKKTLSLGLERLTDALLANSKTLYPETLELAERTLTLRKKHTKKKDEALIEPLWNRAIVHSWRHEYDKAESLYRQALEIADKAYDKDDPRNVEKLLGWSIYLIGKRRLDEARDVIDGVGEVQLEQGETAYRLRCRARLRQAEGDDAEAARLYREALATYREAYRDDHPYVAAALNALGDVLVSQGKYDEARGMLESGLDIRQAQLRSTHPDIARSLGRLGSLHHATGEYDKAGEFLERGLELLEQEPHTDELTLASSLASLGAVAGMFGQWELAIQRLERALEITERRLGPSDPALVVLLNNLGALHAQSGAPDRAPELMERALAIQKEQLGLNHPEVSKMMLSLAGLYDMAGEFFQAQLLYTRALAQQYVLLGKEHPDVAMTLTALAGHLARRDRVDEAVSMQKRALALADEHLAPGHEIYLHAHGTLANALERQGKPRQAEEQVRKLRAAVAGRRGEGDPSLTGIDAWLANLETQEPATTPSPVAPATSTSFRFGAPPAEHVEVEDPLNDPGSVKVYSLKENPKASMFRISRRLIDEEPTSLEEHVAHNMSLYAKRFPDADFTGFVHPDWALQPLRSHDIPYLSFLVRDGDETQVGDMMALFWRVPDGFWSLSWITVGDVMKEHSNVFAKFLSSMEIQEVEATGTSVDPDEMTRLTTECFKLFGKAREAMEGYKLTGCAMNTEGDVSLFGGSEGMDLISFRDTVEQIHGLDKFIALVHFSRDRIHSTSDREHDAMKLHMEHREGWCRNTWLRLDPDSGLPVAEGSRQALAECVVWGR